MPFEKHSSEMGDTLSEELMDEPETVGESGSAAIDDSVLIGSDSRL